MNQGQDKTFILLTGDIHIGRTSDGLLGSLPPGIGSTTAAWQRIVDLAVEQEVDLMLVCGDLVDADTSFQKAYHPVKEGIRKLEQNGITTLAITGNHDHRILVQVIDAINSPQLRLLGRGGCWERYPYYGNGHQKLAVDGWSFPRAYVREDPVESYQPLDSRVPVLGMVHGLLDVKNTVQAPLDRLRMQRQPVNGWILGHYHSPPGERQDPDAPLVLYIGSPQALAPSERGLHGPWLAEIGPGGIEQWEQVPMSDVRYEICRVDITGLKDVDAIQSQIKSRVEELAREIAAESGEVLRYLCLRLDLAGQTEPGSWLQEFTLSFKGIKWQMQNFWVGVDEIRVIPTKDRGMDRSMSAAAQGRNF